MENRNLHRDESNDPSMADNQWREQFRPTELLLLESKTKQETQEIVCKGISVMKKSHAVYNI